MNGRLNLNNVRLRNKMLILYFLCVFAPILLTNVIFYSITIDHVRNQRMRDISLALQQINKELSIEIEEAISVSHVFFTDFSIYEILEKDYARPSDYIAAYDSYYRRILNNYTPIFNSIQNIKIYVDNPSLLHAGGIGYLSEEVKRLNWYRQLEENPSSRPTLIRTVQEDPLVLPKEGELPRDTFSIVHRMDNFKTLNRWEKILKIDLKTTTIQELFQKLNVPGYVYLLNDADMIEFTTDPRVDWRTETIPFASLSHSPDTIEVTAERNTVNYWVGWRVVAAVPGDVIFEEVRKSRGFIMVLAGVNLIIPTLIIVWITRSMNERLVRILRHMKRVKNQHFATIEDGESADEIGQLTGEFNRMTLQIKRLINDVYVADIQKKNLELERRKAQLNALQSQINPHFLFNALETIRMRSLIKKETETARTIHNMAKIFRNSLSWGKDWVTVREETDLAVSFLEIQKYRFGDKLDYRIEVDPAVEKCKIPKMILQPLVENASIHGIEPLNGPGVITVKAALRGELLVFDISDNGVGMPPESIEALLASLRDEQEMGERVGIKNVYYRLKLLYGERMVFRIESKAGSGTNVHFEIPGSLAEEEEGNGRRAEGES